MMNALKKAGMAKPAPADPPDGEEVDTGGGSLQATRLFALRKQTEHQKEISEKENLEQASTKAKSLWKTSKRALAEAGHSVPQPLDESPFLPVPNVFSSWMVKHGQKPRLELTKKQRQELRECFNLIDTDGSGSISQAEITEALSYMGVHVTAKSLAKIMKDVDTDGSGELEYSEFSQLMTERLETSMERESRPIGDQDPPLPAIPFPLLATAYRRRKLLQAMLTGSSTLKKMLADVQRRSSEQVKKEEVTDRKRDAYANRMTQNKPGSPHKSRLGPLPPTSRPVAPPAPRALAAFPSRTTQLPTTLRAARGSASVTASPRPSPRQAALEAEAAPETVPQWYAPAAPSSREQRHHRALSKPLERACRTHLREQRDLRRPPRPPALPSSHAAKQHHHSRLLAPNARPSVVPPLALGALHGGSRKLAGTEVAALLADLSPRYNSVPSPRHTHRGGAISNR